MAASEQLNTVIKMVKARAAQKYKTVEHNRASYEQMMSQFQLEEDITFERVGAGGVPAEWISAPEVADDRVMLYLHGGGYLIGSVRTHRVTISRISRAAGVRALALDYRLSPENTFPAPVEDSISAYLWLLSNGVSPEKIVVGGDSAGAGLALSTFVALRYRGYRCRRLGCASHPGQTSIIPASL